jgi:hypothetical protein
MEAFTEEGHPVQLGGGNGGDGRVGVRKYF